MFVKVRFYSRSHGATAGLIFRASDVRTMTIGEISRRFPYSEAPKMHRLEVSPEYCTWDEAFAHIFAGDE